MARRKFPFTLTPAAIQQLQSLLGQGGSLRKGVRIGLKTKGCSGLSYTLEYIDQPTAYDEIIEEEGVMVCIDPKAVLFLMGAEMDYHDNELERGFIFKNPNEKGRCGCGTSFHV